MCAWVLYVCMCVCVCVCACVCVWIHVYVWYVCVHVCVCVVCTVCVLVYMYVFCILSHTCVPGLDQFDVGLAYNEPDHCFIHKWLLLTNPEDSSSSAKVGGAREGEGSGGRGHAQRMWNCAVRGVATGTNLSVPPGCQPGHPRDQNCLGRILWKWQQYNWWCMHVDYRDHDHPMERCLPYSGGHN